MKLVVRHSTFYRYGAGSTRAAMLLKLKPRTLATQTVSEWSLSVNGERIERFYTNGYGDQEALWMSHAWLEEAEIVATGVVDTVDAAGVMGDMGERFDPRIYLRDTDLTLADEAIVALARSVEGNGELATLHALSAAVREAVDYRSGSTGTDTTAAQALAQGRGVCQDHAHVFIAGARVLGIPARYVTGYLLAEADELALHETHGWAEARVPGLGWVGFDPSNGVSVTDSYVRIAGGMDAHDAAPVRGSVTAAGLIAIDADVRIDHAEAAQVQQLQEQQQQQTRPESE